MERAGGFHRRCGRPIARRRRLPRPVIWLALLAALIVAALGAAVTGPLPDRAPNASHLPPAEAVRFAPGV